MIARLLGVVFNRWTLLVVLLAAASLLVWIVGPAVAVHGRAPLESERARWIAVGAMVAAALLVVARGAWRARRGNAAVVGQLVAPAPAETESADLAAVRERFERAMALLRHARFGPGGLLAGWRARLGGRYLYELPWYLIIGAPGSGKTTALHNCGLRFPLAAAVGDHAVRGVGGTRHCDWWFTDRAVLIDTAGRFTTQDSDQAADSATWSGFLRMLAKARPRQPINGVLVTVSLTDLLTGGAEARARYAATVRLRLQELQHELGIRFPVYVIVTKCDLMAGFMESFATLDRDQRESAWGYTYPVGAPIDSARLDDELGRLQARLVDGLVTRLQGERDVQRRARIYAFPDQFAALRPLLREFVDAVFVASPYDAAPVLLRGVYFVSGTQEGTPIDRMMGAIARAYRLEQMMLAPNTSSGRSYFLSRLLTDVVFTESGLAATHLGWERRRRRLALAGYAAVALAGVGALAAWSAGYAANRAYLADVGARVDAARQLVRAAGGRDSPDVLSILPALDALRGLAEPDADGAPARRPPGWGLSQQDKLASAARAAYEEMLVDALLPRLALGLEQELRRGAGASESQYEALKAYLMLADPQRFDAAALARHIARDWQVRLASATTAAQRERLDAHLAALLEGAVPRPPVAVDAALVAAARARLAAVAPAQRVYDRMRGRGLGAEYPEFTLVRAAGDGAGLVFARASGRPMTSGVPGLFSHAAYHKAFQAEVGRASDELAAEQGWVLGIAEPPRAAGGAAGRGLADEVRRLYLNDYAAAWDAFVQDIRLRPMTSLAQAVQTARLLSAPDSPLPPLVKAIARETTLGAAPAAASAPQPTAQAAGKLLATGRRKLEELVAGQAPPAPAAAGAAPESIVDDRFRDLRRLATAPEGGKAPIDEMTALIGEVHADLAAAELAVRGGVVPPPAPAAAKMRTLAPGQPEPLRSMLAGLGDTGAGMTRVLLRQSLGQEVRSRVGEFCQRAVAGRYPLDRRATREVALADFAQLFGPGGHIDKLFRERLDPYVDTNARPWRFRPVDGVPLGGDAGTLPQFQRAAVIRETFFPAGATAPSLRLELRPVEMDRELTQFIIDVDGQVVRYSHGPQLPQAVQWPGPRGSSQVRVQITPPGPGGGSGMVTEGPWALLRLFDRVRLEPAGSPERFRATFDIDGRKAVFDITAASVRNPLGLRELAEFSCPSGL